MLARSGSGARATVRHTDAVHVDVHHSVGIFDCLDVLSTMGPSQFARKSAKSPHELKATELASFKYHGYCHPLRGARERVQVEQESGTSIRVQLCFLSL